MKNSGARVAIAVLILLASAARTGMAAPPVNVIAFGDWGFDKPERQMVADTMAAYATKLPEKLPEKLNAALLLGDNFRVPLKDTSDPYISKLFENTYDRTKLDVPFYAALGNHDYEQNKASIELAYAKEHPESRWKMPARWYRVDLPADAPVVTVLMLDSDQQALTADEWSTEAKWIDTELAGKRAAWTICCAHHTMFSNGAHGDNGVLQTEWGSLFTKYHVDFYVCGHDHSLQHLEIANWSTSFVIAGGGSAPTKPMLRDQRGPFSRSEMGFAHLRFDDQKAVVTFVDGSSGAIVHSFERDRTGAVKVLANTASDAATKKPLRVIQGISDQPATQGAAKRSADE